MSEPAEREYFASHVAPNVGGDIEFLGELDRNEKYDVLKEAACLLNPIRWAEPFGMVMIEALACGTPVVTSDCGSATEIIDEGETGYICHGLSALGRALRKVEGIDRRRCRATAEQRFSSRRMVAEHIAVYRHAIESVQDCPDTVPRVRSQSGTDEPNSCTLCF
jgi:glycosyltransferase involved in cell wall biosynthesis